MNIGDCDSKTDGRVQKKQVWHWLSRQSTLFLPLSDRNSFETFVYVTFLYYKTKEFRPK
jgi:hypothetical protein